MKKNVRSIAVLIASFCIAGVFGATPAHRERQSDAEIEAAIRAKLTKSKIGKDGFTVHVHNGIATWQGSTRIVQHKGAATRMAKTAGAIQVVNNIKISDDARAAAAGNLTGQPKRAVVKEN
jgi:osmotically-inducible protein OsmY